MNALKTIYCRTSQAIFKFAIPFLPYHDPILLDSTTKIPALLREKGIDSVMIITDKSIRSLDLTVPLENALKNAEIRYIIFDKTVPNPTVQNVEDARELYLKHDCKAIIGFGGGSPIDCAKIVGARIVKPKKPVTKMKGIFRILHRLPFTIAIPTTAGTGSETTPAALITDGITHHKFTINDLSLIPDVAVLDPVVTRSLPAKITATTGMDALTHAVEAYIGRSTVKSTRRDAIHAVQLIAENLEKVYQNGSDLKARENMLHASYYAGRAFGKSYVGYCHAVAHTLGGRYNTPHGLANAVLLPHVLDRYGASAHRKLKKLAIAIGLADKSTPQKEAASRFIEMIWEMNYRMNIPHSISGIQEADISGLAKIAEKEANPLYPVPKLLTSRELETFYYDVMEEIA